MPFNQETAACRCEWGVIGHDALAPAEVVIVVDVLSFSTCVDIAVGCGATIFAWAGVLQNLKQTVEKQRSRAF
jgi:2-phosphosulfolactate phosphatase